MKSPRILYVITDLEVGGVPLHLLRLARHVRDAGSSVIVTSLRGIGPVGERMMDAGIEVRACNACCSADWRVFERLAAIIRDESPDLVHSLLFHANNAARAAAILAGFPRSRLICEIQTVEIERRWHLTVDRFTHRFSAVTVGNSPSVIEHLHTRAGIPRSRLRVIPGGVDAESIRAATPLARNELGVRDDEALLLWVGRLDPIKGLDVLISAVGRLRTRVPVRLLLAGDGPLRRDVECQIASLSLGDVVRLLGRRDDVPRLLKSADVFVFPSRTEGMPNALLEAMLASLPVVTANVPGCRDVVAHERTGLLVPPDDPAALAAAVDRLLTDASLCRRLGDSACHFVNQHHTLPATASACQALYAQVLGRTIA